jgi:hypothetical protein
VEEEALKNLKPGITSRFNKVTAYQSFTSALAKSSGQPPTTRVSDDGMEISFREVHMSIEKWRDGMHKLMSDVELEAEVLTASQDFGLSIALDSWLPDDWAKDQHGYGFISRNQKCLEDPRCLVKSMLHDSDPSICLCLSYWYSEG